ncbi:uncharacterized protein NMK_2288 [Novimethylophilus kurashikiensis]|uniref:Aldehyde dehydrogenase domain-containing protein n=1 Tax=Novimethylophilus kurashikiensis TaxID=1825523 RepID=A0A2R5FAW0_9PROT|nr:aldehyde dehydrogenase family protein [Novimethylophilus kurashikiensis]GBG14688.1 uncharacterized protein NMK_2288 [Novimethylophilus kurashikiensis]
MSQPLVLDTVNPLLDTDSPSSIMTPVTQAPTSQASLDQAVSRLREGAVRFAALSLDQRIALAETLRQDFMQVAQHMVEAGCKAKNIPVGSPLEAEEWATGPWGIIRQLRLIADALRSLKKTGNTPIGPVAKTLSGKLAVRVFPQSPIDAMLQKDVTVDVHMQHHVTEQTLDTDRAAFYKHPDHAGKVVLVLGAGNIAAIGMMDVITKLFNEGKVCVLKMNPVNAYLGPLIEEGFQAAIRNGFLEVVYGSADEGRHLAYHPGVDEIHLTGSDKTYDQIVWGAPGPQQDARRAANEPLTQKPITAELGNISPVIVVPGPYTDEEIQFQAEVIAAAMTMNASFLCNAAKMLVLPKDWDGSPRFLRAVRRVCATIEPRAAYYPGAAERWKHMTERRSNMVNIGLPAKDALPWSFVSGLDHHNQSEKLFHEEAFCSVFADVELGSPNPMEFLERAVDWVNTQLWGTLSATLIVHPSTLKNSAVNVAFERAIDRLEYGTVAVNTFPGLSFVFASPPWGAYPGAKPDNIQSGTGFVHNTAMLEGIEKAVIRAPLTSFPKPGYVPGHRTAAALLRKLVVLENAPSWLKMPGILWEALRG